MICQKYIARCYRVYQHKRNENASFLSIFNGGRRTKWRFSNFPRFWKNSSALGSFNCIFENNSLKALFGQNIKKLKILKLSPDSRYLQKLALKKRKIDWQRFEMFCLTEMSNSFDKYDNRHTYTRSSWQASLPFAVFFFIDQRKKDRNEFEPDTMSSFQKTPASH